uniref:Putative secreted protein n=1 Tax=Anopheles darlingi TaxID=43151 RepID=A0A2M4DSP1_ANODA
MLMLWCAFIQGVSFRVHGCSILLAALEIPKPPSIILLFLCFNYFQFCLCIPFSNSPAYGAKFEKSNRERTTIEAFCPGVILCYMCSSAFCFREKVL